MTAKPKAPPPPAVPPAVVALAATLAQHSDLAARAERAAAHHQQRRDALRDATHQRRQIAGRLNASDADHAAAESACDTAAREASRAEAVTAGVAIALAEASEAMAQARAAAREAVEQAAEDRLAELEHAFRAAMQQATAVAAEAAGLADAGGLGHRAALLWQLRLPGSLLASDVVLRIGTGMGQVPPMDSPIAAALRTWRGQLAEAERIAAQAAQQEAAA